ncbi:UNVERIFIED_CONTAM: hypothetical protein HDU68_008317 [Siphonaria sp. JEL0065]|nr:hypothetical protein HDU68_008317 [Siphonaria sp. JEL0065]
MRTEIESISRSLESLTQKTNDKITSLKAEVSMDLNNHKAGRRALGTRIDLRIQEIHHKLTVELSGLRSRLEGFKVEATQNVIWVTIITFGAVLQKILSHVRILAPVPHPALCELQPLDSSTIKAALEALEDFFYDNDIKIRSAKERDSFVLFIGVFRLGVIVDFVTIPVIAGFTSGACIQIIIQQLPGLLGIKGVNTNNAPYLILGDFFKSIGGTSKWDTVFSPLFPKWPIMKFVGFLRNTVVLLVYTGVSYAYHDRKDMPFAIVKTIPYGLSGVQGPDLSLDYSLKVLPAVPTIFIVSLLEHIAVVKMYGRTTGYIINPNQESIAIGFTNIFGSFIGAIPTTGSFSSSAIKTDVLYYIPNAVLSVIVVAAIFELFVNFQILKNVFQIEVLDGIGFFIALIICLVSNIENALYASVGWSVLVLRNSLENFEYTNVTINPADKMWSDDTQERALAQEKLGFGNNPPLRAVVLDFSSVNHLDSTGLQCLLDSKDDLARYAGRVVPYYFVNVHRELVSNLLLVPGSASAASGDAVPSATGFLKKFKKDPEAGNAQRESRLHALQYVHYSIDEAVEAADIETREFVVAK